MDLRASSVVRGARSVWPQVPSAWSAGRPAVPGHTYARGPPTFRRKVGWTPAVA